MSETLQRLLEHPDFHEGEHWTRLQVPTNEIILYEGDSGGQMYLILAGSARVTTKIELEDGRHIQPGFFELAQGEVFGEMSIFDHQLHSATISATSDCTLAHIDGAILFDFIRQHPALGVEIMHELATILVKRIRATNKKMISLFAWGLKVHGIEHHL